MEEEIEFKYGTLKDPENCPIEELKKQISELENTVGFFDTKQLAIKKFINSVYGALGSKYFVAHNVYMAESITKQGRDLNHYSENIVNEYFMGIFQSDPEIKLYYHWVHHDPDGNRVTFADKDNYGDEYYKTGKWEECESWEKAVKKGKKMTPELAYCINDNSKGNCDWFMTKAKLSQKLKCDPEKMKTFDIRTTASTIPLKPVTGPESDYLNTPYTLSIGGDTDSVEGESIIEIENNRKIHIKDAFTEFKYENMDTVMVTENGSEIIPVHNHNTKTFDDVVNVMTYRPINYIMRHKVKKAKYRITTKSGKTVTVTGDHSCMVIRNNELISVKAKDINIKTDKIITINN